MKNKVLFLIENQFLLKSLHFLFSQLFCVFLFRLLFRLLFFRECRQTDTDATARGTSGMLPIISTTNQRTDGSTRSRAASLSPNLFILTKEPKSKRQMEQDWEESPKRYMLSGSLSPIILSLLIIIDYNQKYNY